jgi:hypothetical protein
MREIYKAGVTPQQKLVAVNNKFGNTGVKNQQGTTRILYDSIQVATNQRNFRFFEDSSSRTFPLTNTGSEGNKLGVGDTMVIAQLLFTVTSFDPATGIWNPEQNLTQTQDIANLAYVNVEIANNQVIKKLTLSESEGQFNKDTLGFPNTIDLETSIVIPPLLPFVVELQLAGNLPAVPGFLTQYVRCQIIGVGGIIAPRTTF